jgi:hypothetical protein
MPSNKNGAARHVLLQVERLEDRDCPDANAVPFALMSDTFASPGAILMEAPIAWAPAPPPHQTVGPSQPLPREIYYTPPPVFSTNDGTASVTGTLWHDFNGNGARDGTEGNFAGAIVFLINAQNDGLVGATATDASGRYTFTGLAEGTYHLEFRFGPGTLIETGTEIDSMTYCSANFTLADGQALSMPAALAATDPQIFGTISSAGSGLSGVRVNLFNSSGELLESTVTFQDGRYGFGGSLLLGQTGYLTVSDLPQVGGSGGTPRIGGDFDPVTGRSASFAMNFGSLEILNGYLLPADWTVTTSNASASVGGRVQLSGGGQQPNTGFGGVVVRLLDGTTGAVFATTTTSDDGSYSFTNLPAGAYQLDFVAPSVYAFVSPAGVVGSELKIQSITLSDWQTDLNYFALLQPV